MSFLFGAATSAHQVEGSNTANDWWYWEKKEKLPFKSGEACRHFEQCLNDIEIISELGHNAHRFSLEWSRLELKDNQWSQQAFDHYRKFIRALREKNIEPVVTLHHFTNPRWFSDQGGWLQEDAPEIFDRYVQKVIRELGEDVTYWITINEPMVYLYRSYVEGAWPPFHQSYEDGTVVLRNMLLGHIQAYHSIHRIASQVYGKSPKVSIAKHVIQFDPSNFQSLSDRGATFLRDWFFNRLFLDALNTGFLFLPGTFCENLPSSRTFDFIGLNYYFREWIKFDGFKDNGIFGRTIQKEIESKDFPNRTQMDWEVYPYGFYQRLMALKQYETPVIVCENGIATRDDEERKLFIQHHLAALSQAASEGVEVGGYLHWSLMDNFEWERGYEPQFGLVSIDSKEKTRKIRLSAYVLSDLCRKYFLEDTVHDPRRFIPYS